MVRVWPLAACVLFAWRLQTATSLAPRIGLDKYSGCGLVPNGGGTLVSWFSPCANAEWEARFGGLRSVPANASYVATAPLKLPLSQNIRGCSAHGVRYFEGSIALVQRGSCTFVQKTNYAQQAGALAVLVFDNESPTVVGLMAVTNDVIPSIPAWFIAQSTGEGLQADIFAGKPPNVTCGWKPLEFWHDKPESLGPPLCGEGGVRMSNYGDAGLTWNLDTKFWDTLQDYYENGTKYAGRDPLYTSAVVAAQPRFSGKGAPIVLFNGSDPANRTNYGSVDEERGNRSLASLSFPFSFNLYLRRYSTLFVSPNGLLLSDKSGQASGDPVGVLGSTVSPNGLVAPLWSRLVCNGCVISASMVKTIVAVRFENMSFRSYDDISAGRGLDEESGDPWPSNASSDDDQRRSNGSRNLTFEARLYDDGRILFSFEQYPKEYILQNLSSIQIGVEAWDGLRGINATRTLPWAAAKPFALSLTPWIQPGLNSDVMVPANGSLEVGFNFERISARTVYLFWRDSSGIGVSRMTRATQILFKTTWYLSAWDGEIHSGSCATGNQRKRNKSCEGNDGSHWPDSKCDGKCWDLQPSSEPWRDSYGNLCEIYTAMNYCFYSKVGASWKWNSFRSFVNGGPHAGNVCCDCGGGSNADPPLVEDCPSVPCPIGSRGVSVHFGCTCDAGYTGSVSRLTTPPYFQSTCSPVPCPMHSVGMSVVSGCACTPGYEGSILPSLVMPYFSGQCAATLAPTSPALPPTSVPTPLPTVGATVVPIALPTQSPSSQPSLGPIFAPTGYTSSTPSTTRAPTPTLTWQPSIDPTSLPTPTPTSLPSLNPTADSTLQPTSSPSASPSHSSTASPMLALTSSPSLPQTLDPTLSLTSVPTTSTHDSTMPASQHSSSPTADPTSQPTSSPSAVPSHSPTASPTPALTSSPTLPQTHDPTLAPALVPTTSTHDSTSTPMPASQPSSSPTVDPTSQPTLSPSALSSHVSTSSPTPALTSSPTLPQTDDPTLAPALVPTTTTHDSMSALIPTLQPSSSPTVDPTSQQASSTSAFPSDISTSPPTLVLVSSTTLSQTTLAPALGITTSTPPATPTQAPTSEPLSNPTADPSSETTSSPFSLNLLNPTSLPAEFTSTSTSTEALAYIGSPALVASEKVGNTSSPYAVALSSALQFSERDSGVQLNKSAFPVGGLEQLPFDDGLIVTLSVVGILACLLWACIWAYLHRRRKGREEKLNSESDFQKVLPAPFCVDLEADAVEEVSHCSPSTVRPWLPKEQIMKPDDAGMQSPMERGGLPCLLSTALLSSVDDLAPQKEASSVQGSASLCVATSLEVTLRPKVRAVGDELVQQLAFKFDLSWADASNGKLKGQSIDEQLSHMLDEWRWRCGHDDEDVLGDARSSVDPLLAKMVSSAQKIVMGPHGAGCKHPSQRNLDALKRSLEMAWDQDWEEFILTSAAEDQRFLVGTEPSIDLGDFDFELSGGQFLVGSEPSIEFDRFGKDLKQNLKSGERASGGRFLVGTEPCIDLVNFDDDPATQESAMQSSGACFVVGAEPSIDFGTFQNDYKEKSAQRAPGGRFLVGAEPSIDMDDFENGSKDKSAAGASGGRFRVGATPSIDLYNFRAGTKHQTAEQASGGGFPVGTEPPIYLDSRKSSKQKSGGQPPGERFLVGTEPLTCLDRRTGSKQKSAEQAPGGSFLVGNEPSINLDDFENDSRHKAAGRASGGRFVVGAEPPIDLVSFRDGSKRKSAERASSRGGIFRVGNEPSIDMDYFENSSEDESAERASGGRFVVGAEPSIDLDTFRNCSKAKPAQRDSGGRFLVGYEASIDLDDFENGSKLMSAAGDSGRRFLVGAEPSIELEGFEHDLRPKKKERASGGRFLVGAEPSIDSDNFRNGNLAAGRASGGCFVARDEPSIDLDTFPSDSKEESAQQASGGRFLVGCDPSFDLDDLENGSKHMSAASASGRRFPVSVEASTVLDTFPNGSKQKSARRASGGRFLVGIEPSSDMDDFENVSKHKPAEHASGERFLVGTEPAVNIDNIDIGPNHKSGQWASGGGRFHVGTEPSLEFDHVDDGAMQRRSVVTEGSCQRVTAGLRNCGDDAAELLSWVPSSDREDVTKELRRLKKGLRRVVKLHEGDDNLTFGKALGDALWSWRSGERVGEPDLLARMAADALETASRRYTAVSSTSRDFNDLWEDIMASWQSSMAAAPQKRSPQERGAQPTFLRTELRSDGPALDGQAAADELERALGLHDDENASTVVAPLVPRRRPLPKLCAISASDFSTPSAVSAPSLAEDGARAAKRPHRKAVAPQSIALASERSNVPDGASSARRPSEHTIHAAPPADALEGLFTPRPAGDAELRRRSSISPLREMELGGPGAVEQRRRASLSPLREMEMGARGSRASIRMGSKASAQGGEAAIVGSSLKTSRLADDEDFGLVPTKPNAPRNPRLHSDFSTRRTFMPNVGSLAVSGVKVGERISDGA